MKILLATGIYPPDAGGPATYTRALARALVSRGHQVQVVCYGEQDDRDGQDDQAKFSIERIGRHYFLPWRYWLFEQAVYQRARHCDVVYLQGPVSEGYPGTYGAKQARKPIVMKVVGDYAWETYATNGGTELLDEFLKNFPHEGKVRRIEEIERKTVKRANRVITPSQYLQKIVVDEWGANIATTHVIPNATEPLPLGRNREELRKEFGIENNRVMLTAVRAVPWKACDFIVRLLTKIPEDIIFVIAGDGPILESWKDLAKKEGVLERVSFLGKLDRAALADWYRASDLFVLPSSYEGFANVIPEAASVGLPTLASHIIGNVEAQEQLGGEAVFLAAYRSDEAWLEFLNGKWPERFAEGIRSSHSLTFEQMVDQTLEVLKGATL